VRVKSLTVLGFRGFNEEYDIDFHRSLTLVYAPNSYGKTSISESFEWLLYGVTSKVEKADSKEEYKGSYRNRHTPEELKPFVRATFIDRHGHEIELKGILNTDETMQKIFNGQEVPQWLLTPDISKAPKPFILQHALKYLLLVKPDERFQGFARLLGLEKLDLLQRNVVSLCTKPDACIPYDVSQFLSTVSTLQARLESQPSFATIHKLISKGTLGLQKAYEEIAAECRRRVPQGTEEKSILPQLLKIRDDAVAKIFKGDIKLPKYTPEEEKANEDDERFFLNCVAIPVITKYTALLALESIQHILERAEFFDLGIKILGTTPAECPFCSRVVDETLTKHIHEQHASLLDQKKGSNELQKQKDEVKCLFEQLKTRINTYYTRHAGRANQLLALEPELERLKSILSPKYQKNFDSIQTVISKLNAFKREIENVRNKVLERLAEIEKSVDENKENAELIKKLGDALTQYISESRSYAKVILENANAMSEADSVLQHELDHLAGTEDISVLVDLYEQRQNIEKKFEIIGILDGLKDLRRTVEQYVANKVLEAVSTGLTAEVMEWYEQIKTKGDPDVHFEGFDMERTKEGKLKARRVQIKAKSYGKELASAVSSLSESKLNALGLCVSIATNLKGESPFDFLIIDDPIQSWDAEHEIQFVEVIRKLIEQEKQIILLSHNRKWIDMVRSGCRTINGKFYEITGYNQAGPHISEMAWARWEDRLKEVSAIVKDHTASSIRVQQAEEEIRIVVAELTSEIYLKKKSVKKNPSSLNATKVRTTLVECGIEVGLVDRITETFTTTDDAHHAPVDYAANKQRIKKYHDWAHELAKLLE